VKVVKQLFAILLSVCLPTWANSFGIVLPSLSIVIVSQTLNERMNCYESKRWILQMRNMYWTCCILFTAYLNALATFSQLMTAHFGGYSYSKLGFAMAVTKEENCRLKGLLWCVGAGHPGRADGYRLRDTCTHRSGERRPRGV